MLVIPITEPIVDSSYKRRDLPVSKLLPEMTRSVLGLRVTLNFSKIKNHLFLLHCIVR